MAPPSSTSRTPNPYASGGGRTPGWGASSGRTPNPYASSEGKTPAWNASSRTPNPYADGGKTPAWNASSRTPNPHAQDGGRTPAWNANSGRTPNPYTSASGSGSTHGSSGVWDTGGWGSNGGASPVRTNWDSGDWGASNTLLLLSLQTNLRISPRQWARLHQQQHPLLGLDMVMADRRPRPQLVTAAQRPCRLQHRSPTML